MHGMLETCEKPQNRACNTSAPGRRSSLGRSKRPGLRSKARRVSTQYSVLSTQHSVLSTQYSVLSTQY